MTTSGTYNFVNVRVHDLVTEAAQRCGIPEERANGMIAHSARRSLNLLQSEWSNKNLNLWTVDQQELTLTAGEPDYVLADGTVDILEFLLLTQGTAGSEDAVYTKLGRMARSDYAAIPQKRQTGQPGSYTVHRQIEPYVSLYAAPTGQFTHAVYNRIRHLQDVTSATETFDVPQRFLEAITADLAKHLARKFATDRYAMLSEDAASAWVIAAAEDRDRAVMSFTPNMTGWN